MNFQKKWFAAAVCATLVALMLPFGAGAGAATTPPWEPDANAEGTLTFFDSTGAVMTHGTNLAHLFDYAEASTVGRAGTTKATLYFGFPDHTKADSTTWFASTASGSTNFPTTTAPASINALTNPVVTLGPTDANLAGPIATATLDTSPGYAGIVQIRVKDSGIGKPVQVKPFWTADILVDQTAGTWTQVYPAPAVSGPTTTATTLGATPAATQVSGSAVSLTATVSPVAAGTVQFKDGATDIGAPVTVTAGTATTSTTTLGVGPHTLTAAFTPSDATAFAASASAGLSYTITNPAAAGTTTTLAISPSSPITVGPSSTLTATVTAGVAGSVEFFDGTTSLGTSPVSGGTASKTTTFMAGTHSITATFTPSDLTAHSASTSAATSYVVNALPATQTTTSLAVSPATSSTFGATLTLTGTVTPATAVGSVQFLDGSTVIGTAAVSGGVATATTATLAAGSHSLTASFVPTDSTLFTASQSATPTTYTVNSASSSTTLAVGPGTTSQAGTDVTLTATVTPTAAAGSVQFLDGGTPIGSPVSVSSGSAAFSTTTLAEGTHSLTAEFMPSPANFATSTSEAVSYVVTPAPPGSTTTTLTVTPGATAVVGTTETLTATVSPSAATGTVQFADAGSAIGSPVAVSGGVAQTTATLALASHSLTATFVSTSEGFTGSRSATVTYTVVPPPTATTTSLTVTPAGPVILGTSVTLAAVVGPASAAGTITFLDGSTVLDTETVASGSASLSTVGLTSGSHSVTASFTPSSALAFGASASSATTLVVDTGTPGFTSVTSGTTKLFSGAVLTAGERLTANASGFASNETVTVEVHSATTVIGTTRATPLGTVTVTFALPATLAAGDHTLSLVGAHGTATFKFVVLAGSAVGGAGSGSGSLANTGADILGGTGLGLALVVVGAVALLINPRRIHRGFHRHS